jgi:hypothetical protein
MNGIYPQLFSDAEAGVLREHGDQDTNGDGDALGLAQRAAIRAALSEHRRATMHAEQLERLEAGLGKQPVELPFLFRPQLDMEAVEDLADRIEAQI